MRQRTRLLAQQSPPLRPGLSLNISDLPNELWLQIIEHIPSEKLYQLIGLNKFFLEIGLDVKWKEVVIDTEYIHAALHFLRRMRDPFIATRVKTLLLCLRNFTAASGSKKFIEPKSNKFGDKLASYFRFSTKSQVNQNANQTDAVSSLLTTLPHLCNVSELDVELWHVPADICTPLFRSICSSFGKNLNRLVIGGHLDVYRVLVEEALPKFEKLKILQVELINRLQQPGDIIAATGADDDRAILVNSVAPFVAKLAPTLETLRVWSWAAVDFSGFYDVLSETEFPMLKRLFVRMAFDQTLRHPRSLKAFLVRCGGLLEDLELRLNISRVQLDPTMEEPLGIWLDNLGRRDEFDYDEENSKFLTLPKLLKLDLYPSNTEPGMQALLSVIQATKITLLDLTVRDRYFPPRQAKVVVEAVAGQKLKRLRMNVVRLDVELLELLAKKLPCLGKLWLSISEVAGSDGMNFQQVLKTKRFDSWKVWDICIWQGGQEMDRETMMALATAIPSVTSFFESGNLVQPESALI